MPLVVAGTDVTESQSNTYALDFFDIETEDELHDRFPGVHRYLFDHVKPERDENDREQYRLNWWRFAEPRPRLRAAISGLRRRSEEHTSELQSLMRISYAVFCLKKKTTNNNTQDNTN